jgi:ABC-type lipoprotein export system ATPase subunit
MIAHRAPATSSPDGGAAIAGEDLFLIYRTGHGDVSALRGLDLTVKAGEHVAVLGPSGAGKSSLLSLCAGFAQPSSGRLRVAGTAIESAGSRRLAALRRDELGIVRQHFRRSLPEELTAQEIVGLPLRLAGRDDPDRAAELLERAGLGDRLDARPPELSGGEQQRVAVCAALVKQPRVVLADEPTGELDGPTSGAVVELLLGLAEDAAVLLVTHDLAVATRADRIVHVRDGRVSAEGEAEQDLVVDDQGWLRLPRELREQAGIGRTAHASLTATGIELRPVAATTQVVATPQREAATGGLDVELRGVAKAFGDRAVLNGLSHRFAAGSLHVVAGPSGSGKTTLLSLLAALDRPDAGTLAAGGEPFERLDDDAAAAWRRAHVGYLSQQPLLATHLSARENVALALQLKGRTDERDWLDWVGLAAASTRPAGGLSGGEQRRVGLAQAMAGTPPILLVDEPTAHLDRASGRQVVALLTRAAHERGATVIASTHDTDLIAAADHVLDLARVGA